MKGHIFTTGPCLWRSEVQQLNPAFKVKKGRKFCASTKPRRGCGFFLLTVGSFLLIVELFYLQLTILAFLLTIGAFLLTVLASLLTVGALRDSVSKEAYL